MGATEVASILDLMQFSQKIKAASTPNFFDHLPYSATIRNNNCKSVAN